jgi:hypothetical protein
MTPRASVVGVGFIGRTHVNALLGARRKRKILRTDDLA